MKKIYFLLLSLVVILTACNDDDTTYKVYPVSVKLEYPSELGVTDMSGVNVKATSGTGVAYAAETNVDGVATFELPSGLYEFSATDKRSISLKYYIFTGLTSNFAVTEQAELNASLKLVESVASQIVIKELYVGGCAKDDGSGAFNYDKYVVIYNNSDVAADLKDVCLAITIPYVSTTTTADNTDYESEGWVPAGQGLFYFQNSTVLQPRSQVVVALTGAIDNTQSYSNSVDLSKSEYYVTYAPEHFPNVNYHPAPSSNIDPSHYLEGYRYGAGNAWTVGNVSPAFFIFSPQGTTPSAFIADTSNENLYNGNTTQVRKKVPVSWVHDAIEVFRYGANNNTKRFFAGVDAGYVNLINGNGYSLYRNVDKDATEALESNEGKLVYNYALGTVDIDGTTDPSGIDAEASIRNGAEIIYLNTNNSSNDFHLRKQASLKD